MTATTRTLLNVYLTGGIASSISILLTVISMIALRPALSHTQRQSTLPFLVALSVGCLSGDAIFHLLPHVFLGETYSAKIEKNNTIDGQFKSRNVHHSNVLWNALPIACTIYALYLMHLLSETCSTTKHSHSHLPGSETRTEITSDDYNESTEKVCKQYIQEKTENENPDHYPAIVCMIFIGDAVHSFTDGMAIGGAYAKSFYGGLSTTIAIMCHEVPHCVGDFAVLVTTGLTYAKSLFLLTIAMVPMYFGMILGATLSQLMDLTRVIFAVSAALFLFISLTALLPGMLNRSSKGKNSWYLPVIHSFGILLGMAAMLGIAILEGKLSS